MGCDIHLAVEVEIAPGVWEQRFPEPEDYDPCYKEQYARHNDEWYANQMKHTWFNDRNYILFAILAGVRNDCNIVPISEPKGWPDNLSPTVRKSIDDDRDGVEDDLNGCNFWMGEHSESWLTLRELLDYHAQTITDTGIVNQAGYVDWIKNGRGEPSTYCSACSGGNIRHVSNVRMDEIVAGINVNPFADYHTSVSWSAPAWDLAGDFYTNFIPKLQQLGDPDKVRIVFGFDS